MEKLILVRAGRTAWDNENSENKADPDDRRLQGTLPLPLSTEGKEPLRLLAKHLTEANIKKIYSSGNESSGATAEFLANICQVKLKTITDMHELDCGLWQGLRIADIKQRYGKAFRMWQSDPTSICPPEGEAIENALDRMQDALKLINRKNTGKTISIVAAPIAAALIECILTGKPLNQLWNVIEQEAEMTVFNLTDNGNKNVPTGTVVVTQE
ncbi:MAG: histidine phosphatase family protein [Phycisphaerae bacterium]|nr:histidine phosphatase family protein [Phycisphaerae bacterium]